MILVSFSPKEMRFSINLQILVCLVFFSFFFKDKILLCHRGVNAMA